MRKSNSDNGLQELAAEIRAQAYTLRMDTFLSFIYTADVMNRYLDLEFAARLQSSRTGFSVLHFLVLNGGRMKPTDISKRIFRSKHTVTTVIDTLEKQGMVKREPIGKDRRSREVSITKKGVEFVKEHASATSRRICSTVFSNLEKEQIEQLNVTLKKLRKHLIILVQEEE